MLINLIDAPWLANAAQALKSIRHAHPNSLVYRPQSHRPLFELKCIDCRVWRLGVEGVSVPSRVVRGSG